MGIRKGLGFTLIELLVVVSIIAVLLALLMPALDRSLYLTQLAVCGVNQRNVALGALNYTSDHRRFYPTRMSLGRGVFNYGLKAPIGFGDPGQTDDRPKFKGYIDLAWLMDPLCVTVDLAKGVDPSNEAIYANYVMWWGWAYRADPEKSVSTSNNNPRVVNSPGWSEKGMNKRGDRLEVTDTRHGRATWQLPWLISDLDIIGQSNTTNFAGHPDRSRTLHVEFAQAGQFNYEDPNQGAAYNAAITVTYSFWRRSDNYNRGLMDLNSAGDDGSVKRVDNVKYDPEPRVVCLPSTSNKDRYPGLWQNIAKP